MKEFGSLNEAIKELYGSDRIIRSQTAVSGGDINEAKALTLDDETKVFVKSNHSRSALDNFRAEAEGLEAISFTGAIGVPGVLGLGQDAGVAFLLLEYIDAGKKVKGYWEVFAAELAAMHGYDVGDRYGFPRDNWIGARKQINNMHDSWIEFFRDCRLEPQFAAADRYFSAEDRKRIRYLIDHLDQYLLEPARPSLVHGDLWSGNMVTGNDGKGWLIDPAIYYGHPEADLAMTELFGGFSGIFYEAYKEYGRLEPGYEDRRDLYNLYQLLNHLNMFGGGYLGSVMRIVNRYGC